MTQYTGENLKARLLIALAELPMRARPDEQHIHVTPGQDTFYVAIQGDGNPFAAAGHLPLSELPDIQTALQQNRALQSAYLLAQVRQPKHAAARRAVENAMQETMHVAIGHAPLMTDVIKVAIANAVAATFKPQFDAIAMARQTDFTKAMPRYADMRQDMTTYLQSIDLRAKVQVAQMQRNESAPETVDSDEEFETCRP